MEGAFSAYSFPHSARQPLLGPNVQREPFDFLSTFACCIFPSVGTWLFGYEVGAAQRAAKSVISSEYSGTTWYGLSPLQLSLVSNGGLVGALLVSCVALFAGNRWGRRSELAAAAAFYGASSVLSFTASSAVQLLVFRLLYGVGVGLALHAGSAYIAETVPASVRGAMISLKEAMLVAGILTGYLVSFAFHSVVGGWRNVYMLAAPAAVVLGAGMVYLPESPRWLLLNRWQSGVMAVWLDTAGRVAIPDTPGYREARAALVRARGRRAALAPGRPLEAELSAMAVSVREASMAGSSPLRLLAAPLYYKPLLAGLLVVVLNQATGQPAVQYYSSGIFRDAGVMTGQEELVGGLRLVLTLVAAANVDVWGRRPLLLVGASGMALALLALAAAQWVPTQIMMGGPLVVGLVSVMALLTYICCYQISYGPISWIFLGEIFPLAVRGPAMAAANIAGLSSSLLVNLVLPPLDKTVGSLGTYTMFALISMLAVYLLYFTVPELKGKTLEQVEITWAPLPSMCFGHASFSEWLPLNTVLEEEDGGLSQGDAPDSSGAATSCESIAPLADVAPSEAVAGAADGVATVLLNSVGEDGGMQAGADGGSGIA